MKQIFKFSDKLRQQVRKDFIKAQEITTAKLLEELYADYIEKRVYSNSNKPKSQNPFYERTNLLKMKKKMNLYSKEDTGLFVTSDAYYHGGEYGGIYGGIETNDALFWSLVDNNPEHENQGWQHASLYWDEIGEKQIGVNDFINIINNGVSADHSIFGERPATHFWTDFVEFVSMGEYRKIFTQTLVELGYKIEGDIKNSLTTRNGSKTVDIKVRRRKFKEQDKFWD